MLYVEWMWFFGMNEKRLPLSSYFCSRWDFKLFLTRSCNQQMFESCCLTFKSSRCVVREKFICEASIIAPHWALTSAKCTFGHIPAFYGKWKKSFQQQWLNSKKQKWLIIAFLLIMTMRRWTALQSRMFQVCKAKKSKNAMALWWFSFFFFFLLFLISQAC